jgi:hypothetical protein
MIHDYCRVVVALVGLSNSRWHAVSGNDRRTPVWSDKAAEKCR